MVTRKFALVNKEIDSESQDVELHFIDGLGVLTVSPTCIPTSIQWPRGLRHRSAAARLLKLWVRMGMDVCLL